MSTGKFWKCPGEPRLYIWLLGFGICGVLFSWLGIVIIIERIFHHDNPQRRPIIILYIIIGGILFIFTFTWSIIGVRWSNPDNIKDTYYYINGQNLYCNQVILKYTQAMSLITLISSAIVIGIIGHIMKNSNG